MKRVAVTVEGKELAMSNLEKVLWPEEEITKGELIDYYRRVAPFLLLHLKDRPLTMSRYPNGIHGKQFFQKDCPEHAPDWVMTTPVPSSHGGKIDYVLARDLPTLLWMANLGCIEIHPWLSTWQMPNFPSAMVFDLDPNEGAGWGEVLRIALLLREALAKFQLKGYPKTSGATGLHIYVPLRRIYTYQQVQKAAGLIAGAVAGVLPDIATVERMVKKRGSRVYVDYLQNASGKTIASVYSVRPTPGGTVSFPVAWPDIEKKLISPEDFHLRNVPSFLEKSRDAFSPLLTEEQSIDGLLTADL